MRRIAILIWALLSAQLSFSEIIDVPGDEPTIQAGINIANDLDEVHVAPGVYTENLDFLGKNIKVIGNGGASQTTLVALNASDPAVTFATDEAQGTEFSGFTVTGCTGQRTIFISNNAYPTISHCIFHGFALNKDDAMVIRVRSDALIKYNLFYNNGGISCIGIGETGAASIINNTFDNNRRGFHCINGSVIARNNIVTNSTDYGIYGSFADLSYNCVWNNNPDYDGGAGPGTGGISTDPLYFDELNLDYRLTFSSPCIDAGHPDPQYHDPNGSRNDMGAFPLDIDLPMALDINYGPEAQGHSVPSLIPEIHWSYFDTIATGQAQYEIEVGTDDDWTVAEMWATGPVSSSNTQATYAGSPLEDRTTYFLRIRLSDGSVWGGWSYDYFYPHLTYVIHVPGEYAQIQEAIDNSYDDDTILVAPGIYVENLNYAGKRIKVIGAGGAPTTTLQPEDPMQPAIRFINAEEDGTEFRGFTVTGGSGDHMIEAGKGSFPTISHCVFHGFAKNNDVSVVIRVVSDALIKYNLFYGNGGISCIGIGETGAASIINNTFDDNRRGFHCLSGAAIAKNNIVTNSQDYGIFGTFAELSYNCVRNNSPNYDGGASAGTGSISADPLYFNAAEQDYTLSVLSPCIDAGDPDPQYNDPDGSRNDMGAYPSSIDLPVAVNINFGPDAVGDIVSIPTPDIYWSYYDTAATTQVQYELEVGTDNDWSVAEMWATGPVTSPDTQVVYGGAPLAQDVGYFLRIRVSDGSVWGSWSSKTLVYHTVSVYHVPSEYALIQDAIDAAYTGDSVIVAPGVYVENITFSGKGVVVKSSSGPEATTIQAADPNVSVVSFVNFEPRYAVLSGFTITGSNSSGIYCTGSSPTILDNIITANTSPAENQSPGIDMNGTYGSMIRGNIIHLNVADTYGPGIHFESSTNDTACYNILYDNVGYSEIRGLASAVVIFNNTISVTTDRGIECLEGGNFDARNNIIQFAQTGMFVADGVMTASYNCMHANGTDFNFSGGPGNIFLPPEFVDSASGDYSLDVNSPCIDAGDPDPQFNDPDGTRNDIGAIPSSWNFPIASNINYGPGTEENILSTFTPDIYWSYFDTAATSQVQYEIEVGTDDDWTVAEMWATGPVMSPDTQITYSGTALEGRIPYHVRIRLFNGTDWGSWRSSSFIIVIVVIINVPDDEPTIQAAINAAFDLDEVHVAPGTYNENINLLGKRIKVIGTGGALVTTLLPVDIMQPAVSFVSGEPEGTEFSGFTVTGADGDHTIEASNNAYPTISHCIFYGFALNRDDKDVVIRVNSNALIRYNLFYNNGGISCIGKDTDGVVSIINNTFDGNNRGFHVLSGTAIAMNNIVTNSSQYGIFGYFSELSYNCVWNNNPDYDGGATPGTGSFSADPLYYDAANQDYSLEINSSCIDAGNPDPLYNDPDGSRNDMGAFPFDLNLPIAANINYGPDSYDHTVWTLTPDIYWSYLDTAATSQAQYELEVGTDADWSAAEMWATGPVMSADTQLTYAGAILEDHSLYYVRIRVSDGSSWGDWRQNYFTVHITNVINVPGDYATIQEAIAAAFEGDSILVASGVYIENIDFLGKGIKVIGTGGALQTTLQPADPVAPVVSFANLEPGNTEFSGFTVTGGSGDHEIVVEDGSCPTISHCIFHGFALNKDDVAVVIRVNSVTLTTNIKYNLFYNNGGISCIGLNGAGRALIINNTFDSNNRGFHCLSGLAVAMNNIVTNSSQYGIYGSFTDLSYNCVWNNNPDYDGGATPGTGSFSSDPLYFDSDNQDYSLGVLSPCIDAGNPDPQYNDPDGSRNDIGAFPLNLNLPVATNVNYGPDSDGHIVWTMTPEIYWSYFDTAATSQAQYELEVGTDADWSVAEMWATGPVNSPDTQVTYAGISLEDQSLYHLRIRVSDGSDWGDWKNSYFFIHVSHIIHVPDDFATIQEAIEVALDGDSILVAPGIYIENIDFMGKEIKVVGVEGALQTTLQPMDPLQPIVRFVNSETENAEFTNFTVTGGSGDHEIEVGEGSHPTISHCIFYGFALNKDDVAVVIRINSVASTTTIKYNLFYDNGGISCVGVGEEGKALIINNTFDNNRRGFHCLSGQVIAKNNIVTNSLNYGIYGGFAELSYNCVWGNSPDYSGGAEPGTGSITADPIYINPAIQDYRLSATSPCANAGDPDPQYNDPDGSRNDMGAFPLDLDLPIAADINYGPDAIGNIVLNLTPEIYWTYFDTAATSQAQYELEVGTDDDWSVAEMWASGPVASSDTQTVYAGSPLADHTRYSVRIRLSDGSVWGSWMTSNFATHLSGLIHVPSELPTIQSGIDFGLNGDTVLVAPGIYTENLDFMGKNIKILSESGAQYTILQPEYAQLTVVRIARGESEGTEFAGFTVVGGDGDHVIEASNDAYPTISHCIFHGFALNKDVSVVIRVNSQATISHNLFYNNGGISCIGIDEVGSALIVNNTFDRNNRGLHCLSGGATVKNNIVTNSTDYGIFGSFTELSYNCVWNNDPDYDGGASAGTGSISADPLYVDAANQIYRLSASSPCIDAGDPAPQYNDPDGSRNDMGAYPYVIPNQTLIEPDTLLVLIAYTMEPSALSAFIGNLGDDYSVQDIDQTSIVINGSIVPTEFETVPDHPAFDGVALRMEFAAREFILGYGLLWDITDQNYSVTGSYNDQSPFMINGEFVIIGHISGDANRDGIINVGDCVYVINYVFKGGDSPEPMELGDANCDNRTNVADAVRLVNHIFRSGEDPCHP